MRIFDRWFRRSRGRPFQPAPESEVADELRFHLERRIEAYRARGMDPADARKAALERFGDLSLVERDCVQLLEQDRRAERRRDWLDDLRQDLRFGIRSAIRAPLFSLLAILTLALGLGANAAVFGVMKSVLLDALPYADADRLVRVYGRMVDGSFDRSSLSAGLVSDLVERQRLLARVTYFVHRTQDMALAVEDGPRLVTAAFVGPGFFATLGVSPRIGRTLNDPDSENGAPPVVVLSHAAWRRLFAGADSVIGQTIRLAGGRHTVVGVLPPGFVGPMGAVDVWVPLDIAPMLRDPIRARQTHFLGMVGRLRPGGTVEAAGRELLDVAADVRREHPEPGTAMTLTTYSLRDTMVGDTRTPLLILMASAGLVLLITCANLAGALLSRHISRRKEFAVRRAVGAGKGRLVRQLLAESVLLSVAGGATGVALATLGLRMLRKIALSALPAFAQVGLDWEVLVFTGALALATGVLFGLAPTISMGRANPQATLREETRNSDEGRGPRRLRGLLVAGQIALSVSLLMGAGLMVRSFWAMTTAPLGFDPSGILALSLDLPFRDYPSPEARRRFQQQLEDRIRSLAGVTAVAGATELPQPAMNRNGLSIEGRSWPAGSSAPFVPYAAVSDDYFRTLRISLLEGRSFGPVDRAETTPVIVISRAMARRYWPEGRALGARIRLGPDQSGSWAEVIGIVGDVRNDPALVFPEPMAYGSNRQDAWGGSSFIVRAERDPEALVPVIRRELAALDPGLPLEHARPLTDLMAEGLAGRRLPMVLMSGFGILALLLAAVGIYALFASMAAAREREIGVRMALGSSRPAIAWLVLRQGAGWMSLGLVGGTLGITGVSRFLGGLLYQVRPLDPIAIGGALVTLIGSGAIALLIPLRRATRVDPVTVLR